MEKLLVQGVAVEYRQLGSGPDLVLLHSLLADMTAFAGVETALAAHRRVTLLNLPGYGASAAIGAAALDEYAAHVVAALDALALPRSADLFGNGFGAFVAACLATRHGERIRRLILADAIAAFPPEAKEPLRAMAQRVEAGGMLTVLDTAIARMFPATFAAAQPALVAQCRASLAGADPAAFAGASRALAALDLSPELGKIGNRTLVVVGASDTTTPPALAQALAGGIRGARFITIPGCGHCPMLEKPAELVALIETFLTMV
jgi:3-oxoadipate enol-lactonase